MAFDRVYINFY